MARKMRDSGVEWIGEVPEGWEMKYLSQSVSQVKNRNDGLKEKNLLSLSYGKIKRKDIDSIGGLLPASFEGYNIIEPNDIVLRLTDLQNDQHSLRVGLSHENGIVTSAYTTIRPCDRINAVYLFYSLFAFDIAKGFYGMGSGVRQGLNYDEVKQIKLLSPPLPEQRRIADYLDEKCAAIDGAVDELKRGIEDCKAWKKAIIFEAVTGKRKIGFNAEKQRGRVAERPMRDSGIPWIGEIPEGWGMECVKHLFSIGRGRVIAATEVEQEGYPVYSSQTKNNGLLGYISSYDYDRNQLTWTTDGANAGTVFLREGKHNCTNVCGTLMPRDDSFSLRFVCYSLGYVTQYERRSDINGFKIMSNEMAHIKFPLPPLPEQQAIADYLDEKCAAIDALVAEKEKLIADLEAYKKSLIFELVTGKREVA